MAFPLLIHINIIGERMVSRFLIGRLSTVDLVCAAHRLAFIERDMDFDGVDTNNILREFIGRVQFSLFSSIISQPIPVAERMNLVQSWSQRFLLLYSA